MAREEPKTKLELCHMMRRFHSAPVTQLLHGMCIYDAGVVTPLNSSLNASIDGLKLARNSQRNTRRRISTKQSEERCHKQAHQLSKRNLDRQTESAAKCKQATPSNKSRIHLNSKCELFSRNSGHRSYTARFADPQARANRARLLTRCVPSAAALRAAPALPPLAPGAPPLQLLSDYANPLQPQQHCDQAHPERKGQRAPWSATKRHTMQLQQDPRRCGQARNGAQLEQMNSLAERASSCPIARNIHSSGTVQHLRRHHRCPNPGPRKSPPPLTLTPPPPLGIQPHRLTK